MKFIELFAGIGGFRYGLENLQSRWCDGGIQLQPDYYIPNSENKQPLQLSRVNFTCVWANEIDKYACQVYRKNYGGGELYEGDITTVRTEDIPGFDLLVGGFPCQAFSIAGKRGGFADTRGTLFFEIARILSDKRPRHLLLENVKGLLSHDGGKTFQTILKVLSDIGYRVEWQVLNSKDFGVPQNRERVFIVGHLSGTGRGQIFPIGSPVQENYGKLEGETTGTVKAGWGSYQNDATYLGEKDINVVGSIEIDGWEKRHEQIRRVHGTDGISPTIPTGTGGRVMTKILDENVRIRRLTPTECERLQGFPDGWTEGISDTQRYKCLGNAVTTKVIEAIGRKLCHISQDRDGK